MNRDKTGFSLFDNVPKFTDASTGSIRGSISYKLIDQHINNYVVTVRLNENNQFLGIEKIGVNKDFLSLDQKLSSVQFIDVDKYYED